MDKSQIGLRPNPSRLTDWLRGLPVYVGELLESRISETVVKRNLGTVES